MKVTSTAEEVVKADVVDAANERVPTTIVLPGFELQYPAATVSPPRVPVVEVFPSEPKAA